MHQNNAVIERANEEYLDGTRTALVQAGLPPYFWSLAGNHYIMTTNITDMCPNEEGFPNMSKWCARTGSEFDGQVLPFGAAVMYLPTPERLTTSKASPKLRPGVFVGYRLKGGGGRWRGEYLVYDLDSFIGVNFGHRC